MGQVPPEKQKISPVLPIGRGAQHATRTYSDPGRFTGADPLGRKCPGERRFGRAFGSVRTFRPFQAEKQHEKEEKKEEVIRQEAQVQGEVQGRQGQEKVQEKEIQK